jgi:hypothetical protein
MRHFASRRFWQAYEKLPIHVRELADKNFALLKQDPAHRCLVMSFRASEARPGIQ